MKKYDIIKLLKENIMDIWDKLYEVAKNEYKPHDLSPFFYSNHVACAIEAEDGQIFKDSVLKVQVEY